MMDNLKTTEEIAEILKVSTQTIWRWRVKGMPYIKINSRTFRYNLDDIMEWLKAGN
jgi:excisionase family DNA binding protein